MTLLGTGIVPVPDKSMMDAREQWRQRAREKALDLLSRYGMSGTALEAEWLAWIAAYDQAAPDRHPDRRSERREDHSSTSERHDDDGPGFVTGLALGSLLSSDSSPSPSSGGFSGGGGESGGAGASGSW